MTGRAVIVLHGAADRARAIKWITQAPPQTRVEFKRTKRSIPQNDMLWSLLSQIAEQREHMGVKYKTDVWKCLFMDAWAKEVNFVPALDGKGVVPQYRSSDLSKDEMSSLIDFIQCWCAENSVTLGTKELVERAA